MVNPLFMWEAVRIQTQRLLESGWVEHLWLLPPSSGDSLLPSLWSDRTDRPGAISWPGSVRFSPGVRGLAQKYTGRSDGWGSAVPQQGPQDGDP